MIVEVSIATSGIKSLRFERKTSLAPSSELCLSISDNLVDPAVQCRRLAFNNNTDEKTERRSS